MPIPLLRPRPRAGQTHAFSRSAALTAHAFVLKNFELEGLALDAAAQAAGLEILTRPASDAQVRLARESDLLGQLETRFLALPAASTTIAPPESAGALAGDDEDFPPIPMRSEAPLMDRYAQPGGVLKNRFGVGSQFDLDQAEAAVASASLACLLRAEIEGEFQAVLDFDCLRGIHRAIFGRVYDWAGNPRAIDIEKNGMGYARHERIYEAAQRFFAKQASRAWVGLSQEDAAHALAFLLGEIYAIHPFREGNSRSSRTHVRLIAKSAGFELGFKGLGRDEWMLAVGQHFNGDPAALRAVFARCLEPLPAQGSADAVAAHDAGAPESTAPLKTAKDPFAGVLPPPKRPKRKLAPKEQETPLRSAD